MGVGLGTRAKEGLEETGVMGVLIFLMMASLCIHMLKFIRSCNSYGRCISLLYINYTSISPPSTCLLTPPLSCIPPNRLTPRDVGRNGQHL